MVHINSSSVICYYFCFQIWTLPKQFFLFIIILFCSNFLFFFLLGATFPLLGFGLLDPLPPDLPVPDIYQDSSTFSYHLSAHRFLWMINMNSFSWHIKCRESNPITLSVGLSSILPPLVRFCGAQNWNVYC